jgi:hypothetical protein
MARSELRNFLIEKGIDGYSAMKLVDSLTHGVDELISFDTGAIAEILSINDEEAVRIEGIIKNWRDELESTFVDCDHCGGSGYKYQSNE